jgi:hypothetical protein
MGFDIKKALNKLRAFSGPDEMLTLWVSILDNPDVKSQDSSGLEYFESRSLTMIFSAS